MPSRKKIFAGQIRCFCRRNFSEIITTYRTRDTKMPTIKIRFLRSQQRSCDLGVCRILPCWEGSRPPRIASPEPAVLLGCPLFHELFETRQIVSGYLGQGRRLNIRSQLNCDLRFAIGKGLEYDNAPRKIFGDRLPHQTPLRDPKYNLKDSSALFIIKHGS